MDRTPRPALIAVAIAALLLAAGCSTTVAGTARAAGTNPGAAASAAPTTADPVAWVDDVCGALLPFTEAASSQPNIDTTDPAAAIQGLSNYLGRAVAGLDSAISGMAAAGPSPVEGGDEVVNRLTTSLTTFRTSFQDAKTRIDAVDASNLQEVITALPAAVEPLEKLQSAPDPTADLKSNPELDRAAARAPNCKALPGAGG